MEQRFEIMEETVLDHSTMLEWQKKPILMTWERAKEYALSLGDSWRLPNIYEVNGLIDNDMTFPASKFPGMVSDYLWSSSPIDSHRISAFIVNFRYGDHVYDVPEKNFVLCVREVRG